MQPRSIILKRMVFTLVLISVAARPLVVTGSGSAKWCRAGHGILLWTLRHNAESLGLLRTVPIINLGVAGLVGLVG